MKLLDIFKPSTADKSSNTLFGQTVLGNNIVRRDDGNATNGVRGFVMVDGETATLEGAPDVLLGHDGWCPLASVSLGAGDAESITEALEEAALERDYDDRCCA